MSSWIWWSILTQLTGSPVMAALLFFGGGWALEQATIGFLPSPLRLYRRFRHGQRLRRELMLNPHNRKSRFELADLLIEQRRHAAALEVLKPNVAAGDHDAATLYLMGVACYGAGKPKEAEVFLGEAAEQDPEYRLGAVYLAQGRGRLQQGDLPGAKAALEAFCQRRRGTVEGKVLLARANAVLGDAAQAAALRKAAIDDYVSSPRYVKRQERLWAWRVQPWRPMGWVAVAIAAAYVFATAVPHLGALARQNGMPGYGSALVDPALRERLAPPKHPGSGRIDPKRFVRLPNAQAEGASRLRGRSDPFDTDPAHASRRIPGEMLGRIWALYGAPEEEKGSFTYVFRDTQTGAVFTAYAGQSGPAYGAKLADLASQAPVGADERARAEAAIGAFDQLLDETTPVDCAWNFEGDEGPYTSGVKDGEAF